MAVTSIVMGRLGFPYGSVVGSTEPNAPASGAKKKRLPVDIDAAPEHVPMQLVAMCVADTRRSPLRIRQS